MPLLRHGLAELLGKVPSFLVDGGGPPGAAPDGRWRTTILIIDAVERAPDTLVGAVLDAAPKSKVIVLTDSADHRFLGRVLASGAHACLAKQAQLDELVWAIHAVHRGDDVFVLSAPVEAVRRLRPAAQEAGALTNREIEILRLVATGLSNRHISRRLFITEATVKRHLTNAYTKLDVSSRAQAVRKAQEFDLVREAPRTVQH